MDTTMVPSQEASSDRNEARLRGRRLWSMHRHGFSIQQEREENSVSFNNYEYLCVFFWLPGWNPHEFPQLHGACGVCLTPDWQKLTVHSWNYVVVIKHWKVDIIKKGHRNVRWILYFCLEVSIKKNILDPSTKIQGLLISPRLFFS